MRDPESFDDFYAGSVGRVISQMYAMTGDRAEAEDVVQEAYIRAWERWDKIARYADPEGWVRTVAWRITVSSWRKEVRMAATPATAPGTITRESPAAGVKVPAGSIIVLSVEPAKHGS